MAEEDTKATIERLHNTLDLLFSGALFELVQQGELSEREATVKILKAIFNKVYSHIYFEELFLNEIYQTIEENCEVER